MTTDTCEAPEKAHSELLGWYGEHARTLPWRGSHVGPWAVLVSELMLQQTPVSRVLGVFEAWLERWPTPAAQAADPPGEAVRMWGRLGYPRRALRLREAAVVCVERHGGAVPSDLDDLLALPGVGPYTAAAVASFAFRQRHAVLDTNVRRVLSRVVRGTELAPAGAPTRAERADAEALLPADPDRAATWGVALMELGALVCTARAPQCVRCPLASRCAWQLAGRPVAAGPARGGQSFAGTDRQVRGLLLAVLRDASEAVTARELAATWDEAVQRTRALDGLVTDGLVERLPGGLFCLPGTRPTPR
jgi:A/G-specific adenine glycosylase